MNYTEVFENLLPNELKNIKEILDNIINETSSLRITNLKYHTKNKIIICPKCGSNWVVKNGFKNGTQRYKCKNCNKFFSISSNTLTKHLKLNYNQLLQFMLCLINYNTLNETAKIVGISEREAYNLRIK